MTLLISGWVALDDLETPFERVERVLGGPDGSEYSSESRRLVLVASLGA